jgi:predicted enzyme related to lactoylglutathione lyase
MKKMNPVVHFEMPATDRVRMADFYTRVFGWQADMLGEEMGNIGKTLGETGICRITDSTCQAGKIP